jgi:hypothetical protein
MPRFALRRIRLQISRLCISFARQARVVVQLELTCFNLGCLFAAPASCTNHFKVTFEIEHLNKPLPIAIEMT